VMEIPDLIVVNKADHPMTDTMVREVRAALSLGQVPGEWEVPILRTEAATGAGVAELLAEIDRHSAWIAEQGELERRRSRNLRNEVMGIAASRLRRRLDEVADRPEVEELLREVAGRETDPATAAERLLKMTGGTDGE